jgi:hypothetical protein
LSCAGSTVSAGNSRRRKKLHDFQKMTMQILEKYAGAPKYDKVRRPILEVTVKEHASRDIDHESAFSI